MQRIRKSGEVQDVQSNSSISNVGKTGEWRNKSVEIINDVKCFIPIEITEAMKTLEMEFRGLEFSIFCIAKHDPQENKLFLQESYFIPRQVVTRAHVDYLEDAPDGYNCVIHKHPRGVTNFSGTDWTYINQNFDISLLWVNGNFHLGHVRALTSFGMVKIPLKFQLETRVAEVPQHFLSKIQRAKPTTHGNRNHRAFGNQGFSGPFGDFTLGQRELFEDFESDLEKEERENLDYYGIDPIGMNEDPPEGLLSPEDIEKLRQEDPTTLNSEGGKTVFNCSYKSSIKRS